MATKIIHALTAIVFALFCAVNVRGQETRPAREFTASEVQEAESARKALGDEELVLLNALRHLVRPAYEAELFAGRRYRPCPLPSLEEKSGQPMTALDHLRLWAVLQSGMPAGQALENEIARLLGGVPRAAGAASLSEIGLEMCVLRAVWLRQDRAHRAALVLRAGELYQAARAQLSVTGPKSTLVASGYIRPAWFAGHLWRGVVVRAAREMGLEVEAREWEDDLRTLLAVWNKEFGWTCRARPMALAGEDLHPNLMALCALRLAAGAPEKLLSKGVLADVQRRLDSSRDLLARLAKDYGTSGFDQSCLLLVESLGDLAPAGSDRAAWRAQLRRQSIAMAEPGGAFPGGNGLQQDLGLFQQLSMRGQRAAAETALVVLALTGGLFASEPGPLADRSVAQVGRAMYALSVWQASSSRQQSGDFQGRVNAAIQEGCEYIAASQLPDGSFPGMYRSSIGNHGACILTLLHGGYERNHVVIDRAWKHILDTRQPSSGTYANAIVLMALQKYYEPEQHKHGLFEAQTPAAFEAARARVMASMSVSHRLLAEELLKELEGARASDGSYGYYGTGGRTSSVAAGNRGDNSCTQYAMLGFKAASMLGLRVNSTVFSDEAARLLKLYAPAEVGKEIEFVLEPGEDEGKPGRTKARKTRRSGKIVPGGWSYTAEYRAHSCLQMTAAGVSSLMVCQDELKARGKLSDDLGWRIALTIHGAQHHMASSYYKPADFSEGRSPLEPSGDGHGGFYNLYSVERACLLANIRTLGADVDWYRIGADGLLDAQLEDGSWGTTGVAWPGVRERPVAMVNTCMAILFLKQAAMPVITEHKKREREREERRKQPEPPPRSPITPGPEDKKPAPESK